MLWGIIITRSQRAQAAASLRPASANIYDLSVPYTASVEVYDCSVPHPTPFSGDESGPSVTEASIFRIWRHRILSRWALRPKEFAREYTKILYAAELLDGPAHLTVQKEIMNVRDNPNDPTKWPWKTGTEFLNYLTKKYDTGL